MAKNIKRRAYEIIQINMAKAIIYQKENKKEEKWQ